jgi:hypothetical protein
VIYFENSVMENMLEIKLNPLKNFKTAYDNRMDELGR